MTGDPILRGPRIFPAGSPTLGERVPMTLTVNGGLHHLKGNSTPYFSLTYWAHRAGMPNQCQQGGAGHELILKLYPELADLAALHLSDIDGEPMHAESNGWYWLAGAMGGMGETYHGGNSGTDYGAPRRTEADCLGVFARHCRITEDEAMTIRSAVLRAYGESMPMSPEERAEAAAAARAEWGRIMETMRPRWAHEADAAIKRHGLIIYGDPWINTTEEVRP